MPFGLLNGWDDDRFLIESPLAQEVSLEHLVAIFTQPHFQAYHPLHLLSYWLDVPWFGLNGAVIHGVSLVLWVLALFAVFEASRAWKLGVVGALAVTLIVGLHPVQVEAVTWATGRKDILALGFSALAVLSHARAERTFDGWRAATLIAFSAAAFSKTSALPLPLVLLAADVLLHGRSWRRSLLAVAPLLLVALALGSFTVAIWSDAEMTRELDLGQRLALIAATLTHDIETLAFPADVSPLYPISRDAVFPVTDLLFGPLLLVGLAAVAFRTRSRTLLFGLIAFVVLVVPVSNVIPLYFQWQDRYLSLPIWPLAFLFGAGVDYTLRIDGPRWPAWVATAAVSLALMGRTAIYAGEWRDTETLFGHAAATHPGSFYAWLNLGHARARSGHLEGAISAYGSAIEAQNLGLGHDARFRAVLLIDERNHDLEPTRVDELTGRFHHVRGDAFGLRDLSGELAESGYRRSVTLAMDYSMAQSPIPDEQLERAAVVQLERGHAWLADYYVSRLTRPPILPALVERAQSASEVNDEPLD